MAHVHGNLSDVGIVRPDQTKASQIRQLAMQRVQHIGGAFRNVEVRFKSGKQRLRPGWPLLQGAQNLRNRLSNQMGRT
jgi:hypothetical protein